MLIEYARCGAGILLPSNRAALELAILFHDAIYEPKSSKGENERNSVILMERVCGQLFSPLVLQEAKQLIMLTVDHHNIPTDNENFQFHARFFLDLDLGILAAPEEKYSKYVKSIRKEYKHLTDEQWTIGRRAWIEKMLKRPNIYQTVMFKMQKEAQALTNLEREIGLLA
jgi:predicted metal-dependent HD superfamily phosphohydrolase